MRGIVKAEKVIRGRLQNIPRATNTDDATAEAKHILYPETAYAKGQKVTGTLRKETLEVDANGEYEAPDGTVYDRVLVIVKPYINDGIMVNARDEDGYMSDITLCGKILANQHKSDTHLTKVAIAEGVTEIPTYALYGCTELEEVTIPDTVRDIGSYAFNGCSSLKNADIAFDSQLTAIGSNAFQNCSALTGSVVIPAGVTKIGNASFNDTSSVTIIYYNAIEAVNTGNSSSVGGRAVFARCGATRLVIGDVVKVIPYELFYMANNLATIDWGDSVEEIAERAFAECSALTIVEIPASVTKIGVSAFYKTTGTETVYYNAIAAVNTGNSSKVGGRALFGGSGVKTVVIGDGVHILPRECFYGCASLTSIEFGEALTELEPRVFGNCTSLTGVTLPANLTTIDSTAFYNCTALKDIYVPWAEGAVAGAPWGATAATIHYNHTGV